MEENGRFCVSLCNVVAFLNPDSTNLLRHRTGVGESVTLSQQGAGARFDISTTLFHSRDGDLRLQRFPANEPFITMAEQPSFSSVRSQDMSPE